ncbi:YwgA family protein [Paenibacillaceae bacterium WGS1546]|uniref:YwgA family protein n=1 Tax=Cohnella sp. WGS1546 TaxID=3366810 RepID=UPI00372D15B1
MFKAAYSLLCIFDSVNSVYGRKKVQKMVHLLETSGTELPFKYEYHFYGPYSAEVQEEIGFLVQQGFLDEIKHDGAYEYVITDRGKTFKSMLEEDGGYRIEIKESLLNSMADESSQFLEMVSTYAFLIDSGYDSLAAREKALELKPHLERYISKAISYYNEKVVNS